MCVLAAESPCQRCRVFVTLLDNRTAATVELSWTLLYRVYFPIILSCRRWKDHWSQRICSPCSSKKDFLLCFLLLCWTLSVVGLYVCVQFMGETCQASFFQSWCNHCWTTPVLLRTRKHTGQKEKTKVTTHRQNMAVAFSMLCPTAMFSWWPLFWANTIEMGRVANSCQLLIKAVLKICSRTIQLD